MTRIDCLVCLFPRRTNHKATTYRNQKKIRVLQTKPCDTLRNFSIWTQRKFENVSWERERERENEPREARVVLSLMMLTSSTRANSLNIVRSWTSVMFFGTWPTNSFTLSSLLLSLLSLFPSAINAHSFSLSLSLISLSKFLLCFLSLAVFFFGFFFFF